MAVFIKALRDGMVALGIGGGDPVYPAPRPKTAGSSPCATLIQTGGMPPMLDHPLRTVTVQLTIFHAEPSTAMERAEAAYAIIHGLANWALTGHMVLAAKALQAPYALANEQDLARVVVNFAFLARAIAQ